MSKKAQRRTERNQAYNLKLKELLKKTGQKDNKKIISLLDKAVKKGVIHKNKAARLKSRLERKKPAKKIKAERKNK